MGKFKPGDPKPANSGRKKGGKNKATSLKVSDVMETLNFNPTEFLIKLAQDKKTGHALSAKIVLDLLQYSDRKLKPTDAPAADPPPPDPTPTKTPADSEPDLSGYSTESLTQYLKSSN